jgi:hypothetical protein
MVKSSFFGLGTVAFLRAACFLGIMDLEAAAFFKGAIFLGAFLAYFAGCLSASLLTALRFRD